MKRIIPIFLLLVSVLLAPVFAGGEKEAAVQEKQIRIAEQVPNLITPGVWDGQAFSLDSSIYEYLVEINPDTKQLDPVLATKWTTEDGKRWVFTLREGVKFQDGSDFDSADVKYTLERTQDPTIGHLKKQDFAVISSIDTPDKYTVVINLKEPRPTFVYLLTDYNMAILSSDYDYAKFGETKPMGTGPFMVKQIIPKESAVLVKNPKYWDPALPKVDKLLIYFVPDIDASVSMIEAGKVDVVPFITPVIKKRLESTGAIKVISPYQEQRFVSMAANQKPFDDNLVRLAFKYTMDPEIISKSVTQTTLGDGSNYCETPIMNSLAQYMEIPLRERNIEKAKSLLAEAGYPDGVSVDLYFASDHPFGKELAQTIKELAAPAGFTINLKGYPRDVYLTQYWLNVPMSITGWGGRIDPSMLLSLAFKSTGPWNESHMNNPKVDTLIDKISAEVNPDTRMEYYHELQQLFYDEGTLVNVQVPYLVAVSDKIVDYKQPLTMIPQYKYIDIK
ncbi:ABC transporter substrate-binding protein [uncultured Sphaerochaeta sp.]|uniref:ABC transporter substrate-binding protein n=1 Tax=uncultured Sphaerochaeta sp. TaxID=886478 RepID=UPI002A0A7A6F|nr:ABC transporter substrate-binding protein [uncultured Sphaerochaeta sp.]